jgi:hypothetical protein
MSEPTTNKEIAGHDPPFDVLIRATEQVEYPNLPVLNKLELREAARTFESIACSQNATPFELSVTFNDDRDNVYRTDMGNYGDIAPVFSARAADGALELNGGFASHFHRESRHATATIDFRSWQQRLSDELVAATVWILVGGRAPIIFPDPIPVPERVFRPWSLECGLRCNIANSPALIRLLHGLTALPDDKFATLAIARLGDSEHEEWLAALRLLLSLVCGVWLEPALQLKTTTAGATVWLRSDCIHPFSSRQATPAIETINPHVMRILGDQFEEVLNRCNGMFQEGVRLDVAIQYLLAGHNGTEAEIGDMCSAIDAVAESTLLETAKRRFISKNRFHEVRATLDSYLAESLPEEESGFRRRVGEILGQAVRESTGEKQRALWEATGIQIGDRETLALQHRHKLRHKGFIPFDYNDNAQWRRIFEDSGLLRTLANRMLLSILGFSGDALPYNGQWNTRIVPVILNANKRIGPVEGAGLWFEDEK